MTSLGHNELFNGLLPFLCPDGVLSSTLSKAEELNRVISDTNPISLPLFQSRKSSYNYGISIILTQGTISYNILLLCYVELWLLNTFKLLLVIVASLALCIINKIFVFTLHIFIYLVSQSFQVPSLREALMRSTPSGGYFSTMPDEAGDLINVGIGHC